MSNIKDETGKRYGRLTVLRMAPKRPRAYKGVHWICACDCGNEVEVFGTHLRTGNTKSCGCLLKDISVPSEPKPQPVTGDLIETTETHTKVELIERTTSWQETTTWKLNPAEGKMVKVSTTSSTIEVVSNEVVSKTEEVK